MDSFLLVPGLNCTGRVFAGIAGALRPYGPVILADHTRGEDMRTIARAILGDAPATFNLVGFSMGGYIAFEIMRQAPERVSRLALIDTLARPDDEAARAKRRRAIAIAEKGGFSRVLAEQFPLTVDSSHIGDKSIQTLHRSMAEELGVEVYIRQQTAILNRQDSRPLLKNITVPTAIIVGEADQVTPLEDARLMAGAIPGASLTVVPQAGHFALLEQPDIVHQALADWASMPADRGPVAQGKPGC